MAVEGWIVRGTIWLALVAFVASEGGRASARRLGRPIGWALPLFALGAVLCGLHFLASFHWHYRWSHALALEATAQQTADVYGVPWGWGLWVNYLFLGVWCAEATWWAFHPAGVTQRISLGTWVLRSFYLLIIVNAAVVFPQGLARALGAVLIIFLVCFWARR